MLNELNEIRRLLLNPPADLFSASQHAQVRAENLFKSLKKQRASCPSLTIDRFLGHVHECLRDTAQPFAPGVFTEIGGEAKKVLGQWRQQGQLLNLVHVVEDELVNLG